jgi:hypothetical protein
VLRWERLLGRPIGVFDRFFEHGGSSLLAARMVDEYERDTGVLIPLTAMFVDDTIDALANRIRYGSLAENAQVVPLHAEGTRMPFVFVHGDYLGGGFHSHRLARCSAPTSRSTSCTRTARRRRGPRHDRGDGGRPAARVARAAPARPYVVGGHCNGAFVAFELARQIRAAGEPVRRSSSSTRRRRSGGHARGLQGAGARAARRDRPVADMIARLGRAMLAYRARPLDVPLVNVRSADAKAAIHDDALGEARPRMRLHVLPGDHVTLVMERGGEQFAAVVARVIDDARCGRRLERDGAAVGPPSAASGSRNTLEPVVPGVSRERAVADRRPARPRRLARGDRRRDGAHTRDADALRPVQGSVAAPAASTPSRRSISSESSSTSRSTTPRSSTPRRRWPRNLRPRRGGLVRWTLFELGAGRHALLRVWHHIMSDGTSSRVLGEDVARAYGEIVAGGRARCAPPANDYATYARVQQEAAQARRAPATRRGGKRSSTARQRPRCRPTSTARPRAR